MSGDPLRDYEAWLAKDRRERLWSAVAAWALILLAVAGLVFLLWLAMGLVFVIFIPR